MSLTPKQRKHQLEISPKGGNATVAKYGVEYMRELAKKGAEKRRQKRLTAQGVEEPKRAEAVETEKPKKKNFFKRLFF